MDCATIYLLDIFCPFLAILPFLDSLCGIASFSRLYFLTDIYVYEKSSCVFPLFSILHVELPELLPLLPTPWFLACCFFCSMTF